LAASLFSEAVTKRQVPILRYHLLSGVFDATGILGSVFIILASG